MAIADTIGTWKDARQVYELTKERAVEMKVEAPLMKAIVDAATDAPADYRHQQGWVLIAFQNAFWQLFMLRPCRRRCGYVMRAEIRTQTPQLPVPCWGCIGRDAIPEQWSRNCSIAVLKLGIQCASSTS